MNRWLWAAAGALLGLAVTLAARPDVLSDLTAFWDDVRDGMREREEELRTSLGIGEEHDHSVEGTS